MAGSALVACSPGTRSMSIACSLGRGMISLASLIRLSVTPLMADTTTTIWSPCARYLATRRATFLMRSGLPTEVPPYFWTIRDMDLAFRFRNFRRASSGMPDARNRDEPLWFHNAVNNAVGAKNQLPDILILQFRNDASQLWKFGQ